MSRHLGQCFVLLPAPSICKTTLQMVPQTWLWGCSCCKWLVDSCVPLLQVVTLRLLGSPREMAAIQGQGTHGGIRGDVQNTGGTPSPMAWTSAW